MRNNDDNRKMHETGSKGPYGCTCRAHSDNIRCQQERGMPRVRVHAKKKTENVQEHGCVHSAYLRPYPSLSLQVSSVQPWRQSNGYPVPKTHRDGRAGCDGTGRKEKRIRHSQINSMKHIGSENSASGQGKSTVIFSVQITVHHTDK